MTDIEVEIAGRVGTVILNRPRVRNAFTPEMLDALLAAFDRLESEGDVVGIVLRGNGGSFCAGADIRWERDASVEEFRRFVGAIQHLTRRLRASERIVVAAIEGPALGGGSELALACDYRVAAPDALIGFPEVRLGLTVTGGVTHVLPRLVGTSRALELLTSGRALGADEALAIGLVNQVSANPVPAAAEVATAAAAAPGLAGMIKSALYTGSEGSIEAALRIEVETIVAARMRPAADEGLTAFLEKRPARFES